MVSANTTETWAKHGSNWNRLGPPLRPTSGVVAALIKDLDQSSRVLLLGVTPEIHQALDNITAVDRSPTMLANVWPGDTQTKTAILADWLNHDFGDNSYDAVIADCAFGLIGSLEGTSLLQQKLYRCLKQGGSLRARLFERPHGAKTISMQQLLAITEGRVSYNFNAFKIMLNFYIADTQKDAKVPQRRIMALFNQLWPDRDQLAAATGWSRSGIDTIDFYDNQQITAFGNRQEHKQTIPLLATNQDFSYITGYDMWEHCPIMRWSKT